MDKGHKRIGEILVAKGLITEEQLQDALSEQRLTKEFLGKIVLKRKLITENDFLEILSEQFDFPYISLKKQDIDLDIAMQFSSTLILEHRCFPIKQDDYFVTVAITNPLDALALSSVEKEAIRKVKFVLISEADMLWLIQQYHRYENLNIRRLFDKDKK